MICRIWYRITPGQVLTENAFLSKSGTRLGSIVGIKVGGTCSGPAVDIIVGVEVLVGVLVAATVAVNDGTVDAAGGIDCPQAIRSTQIPRKMLVLMNIFISRTFYVLSCLLSSLIDFDNVNF